MDSCHRGKRKVKVGKLVVVYKGCPKDVVKEQIRGSLDPLATFKAPLGKLKHDQRDYNSHESKLESAQLTK